MIPRQYTLLDLQKAIVLAKQDSVTSHYPIRITNQLRTLLLRHVTELYTTKHGDGSVCYAVASAVLRKGIAQFVCGCGVSDPAYISTLTGILVDELEKEAIKYADPFYLWS